LLRALAAFDGDLRPTEDLDLAAVKTLRDALEHWDEPGGRANAQLSASGVDAGSIVWTMDGPGRLANVEVEALRVWASRVYDELADWDPFSDRPSGQ
jgi:hypothetical protein